MADWNDVLEELKKSGSPFDILRRKYLKELYDLTGRNTIIYYSGWLQNPDGRWSAITDADKIGLMTAVHGLDRSKGLDLLLHTPGGDGAATESIVDYLRTCFGTNIRAIVPQLAMSAGTMIACACKSVVMGAQSSLGPIDPQFNGFAAHGIIEEFEQAAREIKLDPTRAFVWQQIIAKYNPTLIGECQKAIKWANEMVKQWLMTGMLAGEPDAEAKADQIIGELGNHALTKSHARHLSARRCAEIGLKIEPLDDDHTLQGAVLSVHHTCMHTFSNTGALKIIENHEGRAYINQQQQIIQVAQAQG